MRIMAADAQLVELLPVPPPRPFTVDSPLPVPEDRPMALAAKLIRLLKIDRFSASQPQLVAFMAVVTPLPFARMLENDVGMKKLKLSLFVVHRPIGVTLGTGRKF
jgi:hypothetical protein